MVTELKPLLSKKNTAKNDQTEKETLLNIKTSIFPAFSVQTANLTDFDKGYREGLLNVVRYINGMLEEIEKRNNTRGTK